MIIEVESVYGDSVLHGRKMILLEIEKLMNKVVNEQEDKMFSLFSKKNMNEEAAKEFWDWFEKNESWIIECIANSDSAFIWAIDERLKPVFPYFRGELEFQLGYNDDVGEFFFFHFGKKELARDGNILGKMMPMSLVANWKFILEK